MKQLLAGAILSFLSLGSQAASITITPSVDTVALGDLFTLTVRGEDFVDGIQGGGLDLNFTAGAVEYVSSTFNTSLFNLKTTVGTVDSANGSITGSAFTNLFGSALSSFEIGTITFRATDNALVEFALSSNRSNFFNGSSVQMDASAISFGTTSVVSGSISVIPVPAAFWLFASGVLGLIGVGRRRLAS